MSLTPRRALLALLLVEGAGIAWLVLSPDPAAPSSVVVAVSEALVAVGLPKSLDERAIVEFWLNVLLFVPLGALGALVWPRIRLWGWVLAGFVLSSTLEWLQLHLLAERSSTSRDIIANTLGAALGAGLIATGRWLQEEAPAFSKPGIAQHTRSRAEVSEPSPGGGS